MFLLILVVGVHSTNNTHKDGGAESEVSEILHGPRQKMSSSKYLKGECQQCRGHIEFPAEAVGTTTECPHCGQATELLLALPPTESSLPTKAIVYTIIAIVILVGGLIGTLIALNRTKELLEQQNAADAEVLLRECLQIREKADADSWTTFSTMALLGGSLLAQQNYADAEPLLLAGYEGMKERQDKIAPQGKPRLAEAMEFLVQLYDAWGKPEQATEWRQRMKESNP